MTSSEAGFDWVPHLLPQALYLNLQGRKSRDGFLNLANNEMVHPVIEEIYQGLVASIFSKSIQSYPNASENEPAFAQYLGSSVEETMILPGTDYGIKIIIEALATRSGRIIIQAPNFWGYHHYPRLSSIEVKKIPWQASEKGPRHRVSQMIDAVESASPACVIISNPEPFVGGCFNLDEVRQLAKVCHRQGHLFIIDEAYVPYNGFDHLEILREFENVVLLRSFSKSLGLAGIRMGVLLCAPEVKKYLAAWQTFSPVSGVSMAITRAAFERRDLFQQVHQEIIQNREWMQKKLGAEFPRIRVHPSSANFLMVETESTAFNEALVQFLHGEKILVRNLAEMAQLPHCFRFTVADRPTMENLFRSLGNYDHLRTQ